MVHSMTTWLVFAAIVVILLVVDLMFIARAAPLSVRRSTWWSVTVIAVAVLFGVLIGSFDGRGAAVQFATSYVVEFSLSVDNLLVFMLVLHYFAVPVASQPTVLKWGIIGAIVMRGVVILAGTLVLRQFHWVIYLFGLLLLVTAGRMFATRGTADVDIDHNRILRLARRILPVSNRFAGTAFFVRSGGRLLATPLLLVLVVIEWTDLVFAADSIPAVFAITRDPFLIYASNVFAIVGLRALFFVLAAMLVRFVYLRFGVATVLALVGVKMLASTWVVVPSLLSLVVIVAVLGTAVILSAAKETT